MNKIHNSLLKQNSDHITVCICTYKRQQLLADLLNKLQAQATKGLFSFSILVVDNDFQKSAEPIVTSLARKATIEIKYHVEQIQNISLARNKAIQNATGDFIAFIDDDEIPEMNWLLKLYNALHQFNADAILGPVLPYYKSRPPKWVIKGKLYKRPTYKTGYKIDWAEGRTGNILIKRRILKDTRDLFDPKFGSGGEDKDFTRRMMQIGHSFIWCNEARAYEIVPPHRWKRTYMLKKALLRGKMSLGYPGSRFTKLMMSSIAIPVYTMALPLLFVFGHHWFMQYLIKLFDHAGRILAIINLEVTKQKYYT